MNEALEQPQGWLGVQSMLIAKMKDMETELEELRRQLRELKKSE